MLVYNQNSYYLCINKETKRVHSYFLVSIKNQR